MAGAQKAYKMIYSWLIKLGNIEILSLSLRKNIYLCLKLTVEQINNQ